MKKKGLIISMVGCMVVGCASALLLSNNNVGNFAFADADCDGFHYSEVAPTFDTAGHREFWACCTHPGEVFFSEPEGHWVDHSDEQMIGGFDSTHKAYLPALNTDDYVRTTKEYTTDSAGHTSAGHGYKETWTIPAAGDIPKYAFERDLPIGCVIVVDYSVNPKSEIVYSPEVFNSTFEGIEVSVSGANVTFNVTKEGGYTFEDCCLTFPSISKNTITITGQPLTINSPENCSNDGLSFYGNVWNDLACTGVINTNVTVNCKESGSAMAGFFGSFITVNAGASLTSSGFALGGKGNNNTFLTVNGSLDVIGNTAAIGSSNSTVRNVKIAKGSTYALDDGDPVGPLSAVTTINTKSDPTLNGVKHLQIVQAA